MTNNNHKQNKEQGKLFPSLTFLLLILSPLFGFSCGPSSSLPSSSFNKPSEEIKEEEPKQETSEKIPEGWKVYESKTLSLSFAYPPDWYVKEDEKLGILLSDKPLPERLGPDIIGVPVININRTTVSEVDRLTTLKEIDSSVESIPIEFNHHKGTLYVYKGGPDEQKENLYRFPNGEEFIEVGVNSSIPLSIVEEILGQLEF
jgi:hypothetical protein